MPLEDFLLDEDEREFLEKWLGKIIDRGDLLEELEDDYELFMATRLYNLFKRD